MDSYESTLNDLVMFNVLDITAFCMLSKVLSAFVMPRQNVYNDVILFDGVAPVLLFEFPSQMCIFRFFCFLFLSRGNSSLIFTVSVSFSVILKSIRLALTSVLPANTGTSQNARALVLWYSSFGVVGEYHGGTLSISSRSSRSSKNRILRAPLCLATYLVCASELHPAITCAILSGHSWHIRHIASLVVSVRVLFWLYNFIIIIIFCIDFTAYGWIFSFSLRADYVS